MNAALKPFEDMTADDYAELGLKAGLEIHQQLLTQKKLFCRCPAGLYSETYDAEILRHMRPTLSELGEYDGTALMEFKTKKDIIYRINHKTVCTYEMDDTPPFEINQEALDYALEIAMLLNYKLVSEIHVSRKQYLDGSIPTGFQRTTIVGIDGWIPFKNRKIGLIQLGLEEDACREVSDVEHLRIYLTDRLGMPLIETVTQPDMHTPQEVAEVADLLRWSVRSTGRVRTGIGAARQDVNVSIEGGTRVEIKGVPRIPLIPRLIYHEAQRQHSLLWIKKELNKRGVQRKSLKTKTADVSHLVRGTQWEPLCRAQERGEEIHCVNLRGFRGILSHFTQTGKAFSKEMSDRVRVIACITRLPNILTSESTEETIDSFTWEKIRKIVDAGEKDAQVLVWGNSRDVRTAVQEIIIRAKEAAEGIPSETRQALADGTNGFERILPGPDRMYPDTDLPPLDIPEKRIKTLKINVPNTVWARKEKYAKLGLPVHLRIPIASSPSARLFEEIIEKTTLAPVRVAGFLFEKTKAWERDGLEVDRISEEDWRIFFGKAAEFSALWEAGRSIMTEFLSSEDTDLKIILEKYAPPAFEESDLSGLIQDTLRNDKGAYATIEKRHRFLMGRIMEKLRGHIPAGCVAEILQTALESDRGNHG